MSKSLCKLKKALKTNLDDYMLLVNQPTHVCAKCGRAANRKKLLCDPVKIRTE